MENKIGKGKRGIDENPSKVDQKMGKILTDGINKRVEDNTLCESC